MRKYITEFIGTFFLVFTIGMTVIGGKGDFAPLAIGAALMVMVFAGGHISGAHYNPAVTLAVLIRGKIQMADAIPYWISQVLGACAAAGVVTFMMGDQMPDVPHDMVSASKGLVAEFLGTFALAFVVLNVATAKGSVGNSFYGLSIGFTVLAMAYATGAFSAAFNPAVAIGAGLMEMGSWSYLWVYLVGCFAGAALAAVVFKICNPDDK